MDNKKLTLSICVRCRDGRETDTTDLSQRGGRRLSDAVAHAFVQSAAAKAGMALRGVHCMSQCKRPCTIALSGPDRFTYLFGDLDPELHTAQVLEVAASYASATDGFLARPERPEVLRAGILGRIPPLNVDSDLTEPLLPFPMPDKAETQS